MTARVTLAIAALAALLALARLATGTEPAPPSTCEPTGDTAFEREDVHALGLKVVCYCGCPHLQVSKCYCGTADEIREDLARQIDAGMTEEQIIAAYVAEHGTWALAVPPREGFNWIIWIGPFVLLVVGTILVVVLGRRWARPSPAPVPVLAADPSADRLREELARALRESD